MQRLNAIDTDRVMQPLRSLSVLKHDGNDDGSDDVNSKLSSAKLSFANKRRLRMSIAANAMGDAAYPEKKMSEEIQAKETRTSFALKTPLMAHKEGNDVRKISFADRRRQTRFNLATHEKLNQHHRDKKVSLSTIKGTLPPLHINTRTSTGFAERRRTRIFENRSSLLAGQKQHHDVRQSTRAMAFEQAQHEVLKEEDKEEITEHRVTIKPEVTQVSAGVDKRHEDDIVRDDIERARQLRAQRDNVMSTKKPKKSGCFSGMLEMAWLVNLSSIVSEHWNMFWSIRSQQWRTLQAELDHVVIPPHWEDMNEDARSGLMSKYPVNSVLCLTKLSVALLIENPCYVHPVVRVCVVDVRTGMYLNKQHAEWSVVARHENILKDNTFQKMSLVLPQITHPCKLRGARVLAPSWDEDLVFNESLEHFFQPHVFFLFELLDFGVQVDLNQHSSGFLPIAWSFLKVLGTRGQPNDGEVELQLFYYHYTRKRIPRQRSNVPDVYFEMVMQKIIERHRYPSTLSLNIRGIAPPERREVCGRRPFLPTDVEIGRVPFDKMKLRAEQAIDIIPQHDASQGVKISSDLRLRQLHRQRAKDEICRIPHTRLHRLRAGQVGCFVLAFSPDGKYLAAGCGELLMFPIKVFVVETGRLEMTFVGHHDLIHDIGWSADSHLIASASSDETAKVWQFNTRNAIATCSMQHSSFVYTSRLHPTAINPPLLVSSAFDSIIRIWNVNSGVLVSKLAEHTAVVNSLTFAEDGQRLFSGDAVGMIKIWKAETLPQYRCINTFTHPEIKDDVISCIRHHKHNDTMLVYCRNNALYLFGLRRYNLRRKLIGAVCENLALRCTFSPDGTLVMASSEDCRIMFWNVESGELVRTLDVGYQSPAFGVAWHSTQHLIACSAFGDDHPIYMYEASNENSDHNSINVDGFNDSHHVRDAIPSKRTLMTSNVPGAINY